jgi:hypothetical protein
VTISRCSFPDWVNLKWRFHLPDATLLPIIIDSVVIPKPFDEIHAYRLTGWPSAKLNSELNPFLTEVREALDDQFSTSPDSRMASLKQIQKRIDGIGNLFPAGSEALASAQLWNTMRESIAKASSSLTVDYPIIHNRIALIRHLRIAKLQLASVYDRVIIDPRKWKIVKIVSKEIGDISNEIDEFENTHLNK